MVSLLVDARIAAAEAAAYERAIEEYVQLRRSYWGRSLENMEGHFIKGVRSLISPEHQSALNAVIAETEAQVREDICRTIHDAITAGVLSAQIGQWLQDAIRSPVDST